MTTQADSNVFLSAASSTSLVFSDQHRHRRKPNLFHSSNRSITRGFKNFDFQSIQANNSAYYLQKQQPKKKRTLVTQETDDGSIRAGAMNKSLESQLLPADNSRNTQILEQANSSKVSQTLQESTRANNQAKAVKRKKDPYKQHKPKQKVRISFKNQGITQIDQLPPYDPIRSKQSIAINSSLSSFQEVTNRLFAAHSKPVSEHEDEATPGPDMYQKSLEQIGKEHASSGEMNAPKFSIRRRIDRNCRRHLVDEQNHVITLMSVCRDSPGVGNYNVDQSQFQKVHSTFQGANGYHFAKQGREPSSSSKHKSTRSPHFEGFDHKILINEDGEPIEKNLRALNQTMGSFNTLRHSHRFRNHSTESEEEKKPFAHMGHSDWLKESESPTRKTVQNTRISKAKRFNYEREAKRVKDNTSGPGEPFSSFQLPEIYQRKLSMMLSARNKPTKALGTTKTPNPQFGMMNIMSLDSQKFRATQMGRDRFRESQVVFPGKELKANQTSGGDIKYNIDEAEKRVASNSPEKRKSVSNFVSFKFNKQKRNLDPDANDSPGPGRYDHHHSTQPTQRIGARFSKSKRTIDFTKLQPGRAIFNGQVVRGCLKNELF